VSETAIKGWHAKARQMWRSGATEKDIAARFGVSRPAVDYALRIIRVAEKGNGRGVYDGAARSNSRTRSSCAVHDELDCVAMIEATQRGARGTLSMLRRYKAGE
jgi:hypothetical protein